MRPLPRTDDFHLHLMPLIDVALQLVLFFVLTSRFTTLDYRIDVALPKDG